MAQRLAADAPEAILQLLLPPLLRLPWRKTLDDRKAVPDIRFILKTGLPWGDLPVEMGCGSRWRCRGG